MLLSNCNIQELVTEQVKFYLTENEFTFNELKTLAISKAPILEIQTQCIKTLSELKQTDLIKVKKALENQAYKKQLSDDEEQAKLDSGDAETDKAQKKQLTRELSQIPEQLSSNQAELLQQQYKLIRLMNSSAQVQVNQHEKKAKSSKKTSKKSSDLEEHTRAVDKLQSSILQLEMKMQTLNERKDTIKTKLQKLAQSEHSRKERKTERNNRSQARAGYQSSGEGLLDTLAPKSQSSLTISINDQKKAIGLKYAELIEDANTINFAFFLALLPDHINQLKLAAQEEEALRHVIKLMKKHLKYEQQMFTLNDTLEKKKQSISSEISKLNQFNTRVKRLQSDNPLLSKSSSQLSTLNSELTTALDRNIHLRERLAIPGLLMLTLSFLSTIPLILTTYGIIPFFIAPLFMFLLVSAPPAVCLLTTVAIGIAALVFRVKEHLRQSTIQMNEQTIQSNNNIVKRNSTSLHTIRDETIPALEIQIKKDESLRDRLIASINEAQNSAEQTLKQAREISPVSYAQSTLLSSPSPSPMHSSTDKLEESNLSDELYEEELAESDSIP